MGPNSAVPPMQPCIHRRIQYRSADAGRGTSPSLLVESWGSPFPLFLLPEGRTLKMKRSKGTKSRARRWPPLVPVPVARSPPPPSPAPGRRGRSGARGPALLRQNKAHRGRPRPRTKLVTKASGRRRAPSLRPYSVGREGGLKDGVAICTWFFRGCGISLPCTQ